MGVAKVRTISGMRKETKIYTRELNHERWQVWDRNWTTGAWNILSHQKARMLSKTPGVMSKDRETNPKGLQLAKDE